jgi:hypothetical protein
LKVLPGSTGSEATGNPMFDLFYGKVKIEGKNQGNEFIREEQFGQLPLQVFLDFVNTSIIQER